MKSAKLATQQKSKSSHKDFKRSVFKFFATKKWFFLFAILLFSLSGLVVFLSNPVPVWTKIISQKWDNVSFVSQNINHQPGLMWGTSQKLSVGIHGQSGLHAPYEFEQKVSIYIESPNIKIYEITDGYDRPTVEYSKDLGGYYLSLLNLNDGQIHNLSFDDNLDILQDKQINLSNNTNLELQDIKTNNAEIDYPTVSMVANGALNFTWELPENCYFNILNLKDSYTNNFPSLSINNKCPDSSSNTVDIDLARYVRDGGNKVFLVTSGLSFLDGGVSDVQDKKYLLVLDRDDDYSNLAVKIVVMGGPFLNLDMTFEPESIESEGEYLSINNSVYSHAISNSVGKIKLGSQSISTDEYSDIDVESKDGGYSISFQGNADSASSPFIIQSEALTSSLKINYDQMIKTRWSVFPTEIWSAIIGGIMTILGTYIGYSLGKRKISTS